MYTEQRHSAEWPYVAMLCCVFVLSITIPLAWHRRQQSAETPRLAIQPTSATGSAGHDEPQASVIPGSDDTPRPISATAPLAPAPDAPPAVVEAPPAIPEFEAVTTTPASLTPVEKVVAEQTAGLFADLIVVDRENLHSFSPLPRTAMRSVSSSAIPRARLRAVQTGDDVAPLPPRLGPWPLPVALQSRLNPLSDDPQTREWAESVRRQVDHLRQAENLSSSDVPVILDELLQSVSAGKRLAAAIGRQRSSYELSAAVYDLQRRIDVWKAAYQLAAGNTRSRDGAVSPIIEVASAAKLLEHPSGKLDVRTLLAQIEEYEELRLTSQGHRIAQAIQLLKTSSEEDHQALGQKLEQHYRNANLRIAISGALLNRMLPAPHAMHRNVNDEILGVPVWGNSTTWSQLYVRLLPDPDNIRLGVEAWGRVSARTTANSGPAYVYNKGRTAFVVRKLIVIDGDGIKAKYTVADARSVSDLTGVETDYDGVPLLGKIARNIAEREHDLWHGDALRETEDKVSAEARRRFDSEIRPQLQRAVTQFHHQLWEPLERLGLQPSTVQLSTTEQRVVNRTHVGHEGQLAAHTARPQAPADSLASLQLHESLLNNGLDQLLLDGKTLSLHELYKTVSKRLGRTVDEVPATMPDNVFISFAAHDAVRIRCDEGRVELTLALAKVERGATNWSDLKVRAYYQPEGGGLDSKLKRVGSIELSGKRLRTRDQVALRGVFSKLLSKSHEWQLMPEKFATDPRLADLALTQIKIVDGWIAVAIAPRRPASEVSSGQLRVGERRRRQQNRR